MPNSSEKVGRANHYESFVGQTGGGRGFLFSSYSSLLRACVPVPLPAGSSLPLPSKAAVAAAREQLRKRFAQLRLSLGTSCEIDVAR